MAAGDPPTGLLDIASTLSQDEIPFKLRCAICSKLAVNAFRLPCCDQSICETCQASLPTTCPVCAHSPVSPGLCKPNKALRITLKAFLRTEEKKREKDRQAAAAPPQSTPTPVKSDSTPVEPINHQNGTAAIPIERPEKLEAPPAVELNSDEPPADTPLVDGVEKSTVDATGLGVTEAMTTLEPVEDGVTEPPNATEATAPSTDGDAPAPDDSTPSTRGPQDTSQQAELTTMNMGPGGFPGMGWNGTGSFGVMNPFIGNSMFNFPNPMGMPMTMDPMTANQGMFGDYGMNMTGMGINMGMNVNGQGMYGTLGWDNFQQNMWQGGQDKFNPNAFANGTGPLQGGAFGGSNSSYPSNANFQSGYYGPGIGRGGFQGRGRGHGHFQGGPGRGGFGGPGFSPAANPGFSSQSISSAPVDSRHETPGSVDETSQAVENDGTEQVSDANVADGSAEMPSAEPGTAGNQQLQGIPTIDSLDQPIPIGPGGHQGYMGTGYGRGGYMRGVGGRGGGFWGNPMPQHPIEPRGAGVEGAPAAPRAMRQGLPNTSVLRQRGFPAQRRSSGGSNTPATLQSRNFDNPQDPARSRSPSNAPSQRQRANSPSQKRDSRSRSPSAHPMPDDQEGGRELEREYTDHAHENRTEERRFRSPSRVSSRRSSRHRHRDTDRDRRNGIRSHRPRHHRSQDDSRSRSRHRNGDSRRTDHIALIAEENTPNGHSEASSETGDHRGLASRISSRHRSSKDRPSRREHGRERDQDRTRDSRRRDRDRDRDRDRRDRDRDSDRDRRRDHDRDHGRDRDRDRDRGHDRNRGRDRERDRKRSRRDRSESANATDLSSHPRARRVKRDGREDQDRDRHPAPTPSEPEKDPHTLEREARNRERLLREKQRREQAKSGHRCDTRQERVVAGRRINYKYEDEL